LNFFPSKKSIAAGAKYFILGAVIFSIGLVYHFPYERIQHTLTSTLTKSTGYQFDMDELSPALPIGFVASGARISGPSFFSSSKGQYGGGQRLSQTNLKFESIRVTLSPASIFLYPFKKSLSLSFSAHHERTVWKGSATYGKKESDLRLRTKKYKFRRMIPMEEINPLLAGSNLTIEGEASLNLRLSGPTESMNQSDFTKSAGDFVLEISKGKMNFPMIKELRFDKISVKANLENGKVEIHAIQLSGPDISGTANGTVKVERVLGRSRLNLDAKITISEKAQEIRDLVTMIGGQAGLRMNDNGVVALKVTGPFTPASRLKVRGY